MVGTLQRVYSNFKVNNVAVKVLNELATWILFIKSNFSKFAAVKALKDWVTKQLSMEVLA